MEEYTRDRDVSELQTKLKLSQKEYENLKEDLLIAQIQLQEANDTLNGGITPRNMANFRNTYVINASDSLDDTYPMYVYFRVLDETVKIVSVKVSYWIHNYRAYSKAAAAGGGQTTSSGGGQTSSSTSTPSGGGATSGVTGGSVETAEQISERVASAITVDVRPMWSYGGISFQENTGTTSKSAGKVYHRHYIGNHSHSTPNHTHPAHSHTVANHSHTIEDHTHNADYGIYEEENTPTIKFSVSQDNGVAYSKEYGNVPINRELINITSDITKTGSKILKFESTTRTRLTVQVEVKVDISVR